MGVAVARSGARAHAGNRGAGRPDGQQVLAQRVRASSVSEDDAVLTTALTYTREAAAWHEQTAKDRSAWRESYERLAGLVKPGGVMLDLGCGSGEDAPA